MTPQEIADRLLSYSQAKEPTPVALALVEAAKRSQAKQSDVSLHVTEAEMESYLWSYAPGWMA